MSRRAVSAALVLALGLGHPAASVAQVVGAASRAGVSGRAVPVVAPITPLGGVSVFVSPLSAVSEPVLPSVPTPVTAAPVAVKPRSVKAFVASAILLIAPGRANPQKFASRRAPSAVAGPAVAGETSHAKLVREEVSEWGPERRSDAAVVASDSDGWPRLAPASSASDTRESAVPSPTPRSPEGLPKTANVLFWGGAILTVAVAVTGLPGLFAPSLISGWFVWMGLGAMTLSRYIRPAGTATIPAERAKPTGWFDGIRSMWTKAKSNAEVQTALETRVGGFSLKSFRDWFAGGVRTGLSFVPVSLGLMLASAAAAMSLNSFLGEGTQNAEALVYETALNPLGFHLGGYLAAVMAQQVLTVGIFAGARAVARRLGAGKASGWIGAATAMGVAAAIALSYTTMPMVVLPTLAIEAGLLWSFARSGSWLAPLAGRFALSLFSLESARATLWIAMMPAGTLVGLPVLWMGATVAALLAGALWLSAKRDGTTMRGALKAQLDRLSNIGAWWKAPSADGRPKSFLPILATGALWGVITFAAMDLLAGVITMFSPATEGAPEVLKKMLTGPLDLVLYNFIVVGFLEEFVFRRNLYRPIALALEKLKKRGFTPKRVFWAAALSSSLIFSAVHYIDPTPLLAKFGMADSSAVAMNYDWSWMGFFARAAGGMVLAWQYARSGILLIPIVAHFASNTMEGLGYRWGAPGFLAMVVAVIVLQSFVKTPKPSEKAA